MVYLPVFIRGNGGCISKRTRASSWEMSEVGLTIRVNCPVAQIYFVVYDYLKCFRKGKRERVRGTVVITVLFVASGRNS